MTRGEFITAIATAASEYDMSINDTHAWLLKHKTGIAMDLCGLDSSKGRGEFRRFLSLKDWHREAEDQLAQINLTKAEYLARRRNGEMRTRIQKTTGINPPAFYKLLEEWGIKDPAIEQVEMDKSEPIADSKPELAQALKTALDKTPEQPEQATTETPAKQDNETENTIESDIEFEASSACVESSIESVGYITIRIPVKPSTIDAHCNRTDRINIGISMLQSTANEVLSELNDILGPGNYTEQVQQFIERKIAEMA